MKSLTIRANIRKMSEMSVSDEFLQEFEKQVQELLKKAEERAKANFRRTLFARDL
jgi:histone H3/H4